MTGQPLDFRLAEGFIVVLSSTLVLDKLGDYLFHKGIAKPFYLFGYRLHHRSFLLSTVPASYAVVATLVYLHYFRILWSSFWPSMEITFLLVAACLTVDFTLDALSSAEKRRALLHHEWVYFVVPVYAFTHLIVFV